MQATGFAGGRAVLIKKLYQNLQDNIINLQAEKHFTALQTISKPSGKGFDIGSKSNTQSVPNSARLKRRVLKAVGLLLAGILVLGFLIGRRFVVNQTTIPLGLPTPVRVAVLADFHISAGAEGREWGRRAIAAAMREQPDMILLVGDFVLRHGESYVGDLVAGIKAPLGVYAALGNHDYWEGAAAVTAQLKAVGVQVLTNSHVIIRKGKTRLALVGIDDLASGHPDWQAAYEGVPKGLPVVLMFPVPPTTPTFISAPPFCPECP